MRPLLLFPFFITSFMTLAQNPPPIHKPAFNDYYQSEVGKARVTGQVINLPDTVERDDLIGFAAVSIHGDLQQQITVAVNEAGNFELFLPENYPAQEIWFWVNDDLYYGTLLVTKDLYITIDYSALKATGGYQWAKGSAVKFSGTDGLLTEARNRMIELEQTLFEDQIPHLLVVNRELSVEKKRHRLDSLFLVLEAKETSLLADYPEDVRSLIVNERETAQLRLLAVLYWNEGMPLDLKQSYLRHVPAAMSNVTRDFYQYFAAGLKYQAAREVNALPDSTLQQKGKLQLEVEYLNQLATDLPPGWRDLTYLFQENRDPVNNHTILENALTHTTTPWIHSLLSSRYATSMATTEKLNKTLQEISPVKEPAPLGDPIGTLDFGATLYAPAADLDSEELLARIRSAFPDKNLYLDFWAVWCGPCLMELPFSTKLHDQAHELPLEFIYLCTEAGGSQEQWQNLIAQHEVPGIHLYVPKKAHRELMDLFSARGYPTYVLLPVDGKPVLDVPRPSQLNREKLVELLD